MTREEIREAARELVGKLYVLYGGPTDSRKILTEAVRQIGPLKATKVPVEQTEAE